MVPDQRLFHLHFRHVDAEWYESFEHYQPDDALLRLVRAMMPSSWRLERSNLWFHCSPSNAKHAGQGWKIHISATPLNCEEILRAAASVCIEHDAAFKFALDRRLVHLLTSKGWPRPSSSKFMTIYPLDEHHFRTVIEALYVALASFEGPYILSDRRYKDSRVVYYRYGGITELRRLTIGGERQYMLVAPDGALTPDLRMPFWSPPAWAEDPFGTLDEPDGEATLKNGRYAIEQALLFSVSGGVYIGQDFDTGRSVVIKEARPATGVYGHDNDSVARLRKEYRLLQRLQETGFTPVPIDLFQDWEHMFLVEEQVVGRDLGMFTITSNPILRIRPDESSVALYLDQLRKIWVNIAEGIAAMHECGITWGDLSIKNVIVEDVSLGQVRLLDLEAAWEEGTDQPIALSTPGFTSRMHGQMPSKADDYYGLGAIMLGSLFPMNSLLEVAPQARQTFVEAFGNDLGIPPQVQQTILECMSQQPAERPTPQQVVNRIRQSPAWTPPPNTAPVVVPQDELRALVDGIVRYIHASADLSRKDRAFPADPLVFVTNPLSVAYGASGVAYALAKLEGHVSAPLRSWMLSRPVDPDHYTPGLYVGLAGVAWAFWELGLEEIALQTIRVGDNHPLLWAAPDLFYGAAGYGLACLRLFLGSGDQSLLERAVAIGDGLERSAVREAETCHWPDKQGDTWLGYARGASGIALFLLYLHLVTGEDRFLCLGEEALAFDIGHCQVASEGHLTVPRGVVGAFDNVVSHYWSDGTAGLAGVVVRYWAYTRKAEYRDLVDRLAPDTFRKYAIFPGLFRGLSGLGNFLLDAYQFTGEQQFMREAHRVARGVTLFQVNRPQGIAFPGEQLLRISTDFGTGSAGIALFLNRLAYAGEGQDTFNFMLDELLLGTLAAERP